MSHESFYTEKRVHVIRQIYLNIEKNYLKSQVSLYFGMNSMNEIYKG